MAGELIPQIVIQAAERRGSVDEIVTRWIAPRISRSRPTSGSSGRTISLPSRITGGTRQGTRTVMRARCHPLRVGAAADRNGLTVSGGAGRQATRVAEDSAVKGFSRFVGWSETRSPPAPLVISGSRWSAGPISDQQHDLVRGDAAGGAGGRSVLRLDLDRLGDARSNGSPYRAGSSGALVFSRFAASIETAFFSTSSIGDIGIVQPVIRKFIT